MINLLPPEEKKILTRDYTMRFGSVYLLLLSVVLIVGIVLLLPTYFVADINENVAESERATLINSSESAERG